MIEFKDFAKLELKVGEIVSTENGKTKINCGDKTLFTSVSLEAKEGDKIIVGMAGDKVFPLVSSTKEGLLGSSPVDKKTVSLISPDQEIEPGNTVG